MASRPDLRHTWFQEPVWLEDALGRILPIPSEYGYSTVEAVIRDRFQVGPGRQKVLDGEYEILMQGTATASFQVLRGRG